MKDRRKLDRKYLTYFSRVTDRATGRLIGYLSDLTVEGAMLIGNGPLNNDSTFELRMDLPENFANKAVIDFDAVAIWNTPDDDPDFYKTGLKLKNITDEDFQLLQRLIKDFGFNTLQKNSL